MNKAILIGNLTRDPEAKTTSSGKTVVTCGIATNERWTDAAGAKQEKTTFHNLVIWGKQGETFAKYLTKGKKVMVEGRIENREYEKQDGSKGRSSEIVVSDFEFLSPAGGAQAAPAMDGVKERMKDVKRPASEAGEEEIRVEDIPF